MNFAASIYCNALVGPVLVAGGGCARLLARAGELKGLAAPRVFLEPPRKDWPALFGPYHDSILADARIVTGWPALENLGESPKLDTPKCC